MDTQEETQSSFIETRHFISNGLFRFVVRTYITLFMFAVSQTQTLLREPKEGELPFIFYSKKVLATLAMGVFSVLTLTLLAPLIFYSLYATVSDILSWSIKKFSGGALVFQLPGVNKDFSKMNRIVMKFIFDNKLFQGLKFLVKLSSQKLLLTIDSISSLVAQWRNGEISLKNSHKGKTQTPTQKPLSGFSDPTVETSSTGEKVHSSSSLPVIVGILNLVNALPHGAFFDILCPGKKEKDDSYQGIYPLLNRLVDPGNLQSIEEIVIDNLGCLKAVLDRLQESPALFALARKSDSLKVRKMLEYLLSDKKQENKTRFFYEFEEFMKTAQKSTPEQAINLQKQFFQPIIEAMGQIQDSPKHINTLHHMRRDRIARFPQKNHPESLKTQNPQFTQEHPKSQIAEEDKNSPPLKDLASTQDKVALLQAIAPSLASIPVLDVLGQICDTSLGRSIESYLGMKKDTLKSLGSIDPFLKPFLKTLSEQTLKIEDLSDFIEDPNSFSARGQLRIFENILKALQKSLEASPEQPAFFSALKALYDSKDPKSPKFLGDLIEPFLPTEMKGPICLFLEKLVPEVFGIENATENWKTKQKTLFDRIFNVIEALSSERGLTQLMSMEHSSIKSGEALGIVITEFLNYSLKDESRRRSSPPDSDPRSLFLSLSDIVLHADREALENWKKSPIEDRENLKKLLRSAKCLTLVSAIERLDLCISAHTDSNKSKLRASRESQFMENMLRDNLAVSQRLQVQLNQHKNDQKESARARFMEEHFRLNLDMKIKKDAYIAADLRTQWKEELRAGSDEKKVSFQTEIRTSWNTLDPKYPRNPEEGEATLGEALSLSAAVVLKRIQESPVPLIIIESLTPSLLEEILRREKQPVSNDPPDAFSLRLITLVHDMVRAAMGSKQTSEWPPIEKTEEQIEPETTVDTDQAEYIIPIYRKFYEALFPLKNTRNTSDTNAEIPRENLKNQETFKSVQSSLCVVTSEFIQSVASKPVQTVIEKYYAERDLEIYIRNTQKDASYMLRLLNTDNEEARTSILKDYQTWKTTEEYTNWMSSQSQREEDFSRDSQSEADPYLNKENNQWVGPKTSHTDSVNYYKSITTPEWPATIRETFTALGCANYGLELQIEQNQDLEKTAWNHTKARLILNLIRTPNTKSLKDYQEWIQSDDAAKFSGSEKFPDLKKLLEKLKDPSLQPKKESEIFTDIEAYKKSEEYAQALAYYDSILPEDFPVDLPKILAAALNPEFLPALGATLSIIGKMATPLPQGSDILRAQPQVLSESPAKKQERLLNNARKGFMVFITGMICGRPPKEMYESMEDSDSIEINGRQKTDKDAGAFPLFLEGLLSQLKIQSECTLTQTTPPIAATEDRKQEVESLLERFSRTDLYYKKVEEAINKAQNRRERLLPVQEYLETLSNQDFQIFKTTLESYAITSRIPKLLGAVLRPILVPYFEESLDSPLELCEAVQRLYALYGSKDSVKISHEIEGGMLGETEFSNHESALNILKEALTPSGSKETTYNESLSFELNLSRYFLAEKLLCAETDQKSNSLKHLINTLFQYFPGLEQERTFSPVQPQIDDTLTQEILNFEDIPKLLNNLDVHIVRLIKSTYLEQSQKNPQPIPNALAFIQFILEQFYSYSNPGQDGIFVRRLLDYAFKNLSPDRILSIAHSIGRGDFPGIIMNTFGIDNPEKTDRNFDADLIRNFLAQDPHRTAEFIAKNILVAFGAPAPLGKLNHLERIFTEDLKIVTSNPDKFLSLIEGLYGLLSALNNPKTGALNKDLQEGLAKLLKGSEDLINKNPPSEMLTYLLIENPNVRKLLFEGFEKHRNTWYGNPIARYLENFAQNIPSPNSDEKAPHKYLHVKLKLLVNRLKEFSSTDLSTIVRIFLPAVKVVWTVAQEMIPYFGQSAQEDLSVKTKNLKKALSVEMKELKKPIHVMTRALQAVDLAIPGTSHLLEGLVLLRQSKYSRILPTIEKSGDENYQLAASSSILFSLVPNTVSTMNRNTSRKDTIAKGARR